MADYFVDQTAGSDSNDGLSTGAPWKTIAKVNAASFSAGDTVSLKKGEVWRETLTVPSSGASGNLITFGSYGTGDDPIIHGADAITSWTDASYDAANGAFFDGANDSMLSPGDWASAADAKVGIFSCWIKISTVQLSQIIASGGFTVAAQLEAGGDFSILATGVLDINVTGLVAGTWYHLLASWDTAAGTSYFYLDDSATTYAETTNVDAALDYNNASWRIGSLVNQTNKFHGAIQELYFNFEAALDLSVEANRREFIDVNGKPADLGSDGSNPTGSAPHVYFKGAFGSFETNSGDGGNCTVTGALTDEGTSPSG